jgi:CheY-like chemotaxis protein
VLVVDDEPAIARALARMLKTDHDVTTATAPLEALRLLASGERFDTIFSDVNMPGLDGMHLHQAVREIAEEQARRIVFVTGAELDGETSEFLAGKQMLRKPVTRDELVVAIAGLGRYAASL